MQYARQIAERTAAFTMIGNPVTKLTKKDSISNVVPGPMIVTMKSCRKYNVYTTVKAVLFFIRCNKFPATITVFAKSDKIHLLLCFMNSSVSSGQKVVLYPWQDYLKVHPDFIMSVLIHLSSPLSFVSTSETDKAGIEKVSMQSCRASNR